MFREDQHSLQSAVAYDLYTKGLTINKNDTDSSILDLHRKNLTNPTVIIQKHGAYIRQPKRTKIRAIAKTGISSFHDSAILKSLISHTQSKNVLELGSSIGLNAIALAKNTDTFITSVDIDPVLTQIAKDNAESLNVSDRIEFINSDVDDFLDAAITSNKVYDFIYVDANHTYDATLRYYHKLNLIIATQSVIVFDDINWSKQMNKAWEQIKIHVSQGILVENYNLGIWFKLNNPKSDYILKF